MNNEKFPYRYSYLMDFPGAAQTFIIQGYNSVPEEIPGVIPLSHNPEDYTFYTLSFDVPYYWYGEDLREVGEFLHKLKILIIQQKIDSKIFTLEKTRDISEVLENKDYLIDIDKDFDYSNLYVRELPCFEVVKSKKMGYVNTFERFAFFNKDI